EHSVFPSRPRSDGVVPMQPRVAPQDPLEGLQRRPIRHGIEQTLRRSTPLLDGRCADDDATAMPASGSATWKSNTATTVIPINTASDAQRSEAKWSASASSAALPPCALETRCR